MPRIVMVFMKNMQNGTHMISYYLIFIHVFYYILYSRSIAARKKRYYKSMVEGEPGMVYIYMQRKDKS